MENWQSSFRGLTTGPLLLPKRVIHTVRSSAPSSNFQNPLLSLRSRGNCLPLHSRLPVTFLPSSVFPSVTCFRRHCQRKVWLIQMVLLLRIKCRVLFPPWFHIILFPFSHDHSTWSPPLFNTFQHFQVFLIYFSEESRFQRHTMLCFKRSTSYFCP